MFEPSALVWSARLERRRAVGSERRSSWALDRPVPLEVGCGLERGTSVSVELHNPNDHVFRMFCLAFDQTMVAAVGVFAGRENTDGDFQRYVESFVKLDAIAQRAERRRACYVLIVDPGNPPPDAVWRKRIADASADIRSDPLVSIVTGSALIRGVVTAINWIRAPPFEIRSHEDIKRAAAWITSRTSEDVLDVLMRLEREARADPPMSRRGDLR